MKKNFFWNRGAILIQVMIAGSILLGISFMVITIINQGIEGQAIDYAGNTFNVIAGWLDLATSNDVQCPNIFQPTLVYKPQLFFKAGATSFNSTINAINLTPSSASANSIIIPQGSSAYGLTNITVSFTIVDKANQPISSLDANGVPISLLGPRLTVGSPPTNQSFVGNLELSAVTPNRKTLKHDILLGIWTDQWSRIISCSSNFPTGITPTLCNKLGKQYINSITDRAGHLIPVITPCPYVI
jgi:hypothetical protein